MKNYFTLPFLVLLFTGLATTVSSQTTYTFANAGTWNSFGTWVGDLVPPNPLPVGDFIVIDANCTLNISRTINGTLTVNAGKTLTISYSGEPSRTFTNGGTFNNYGTIDVFSDFKLVNSAGSLMTNFSGAIIRSNLLASVDNYGTLVNNSGGAINIQQFGAVNNENGGLVTNNGTISSAWNWVNKSGSTLDNNANIGTGVSGGVTNQSGGIININSGSTFNVYCTATNAGTININTGGTLHIYATLTNTGSLTSSGTLNNHNTLLNNGTIGSTLNLIGSGILRGGGSHLGFFSNNGTLAPGSAVNIPGCYYFQAGFTNTNRLSMDINGPTACTQFDQIQVIGTTTKGGVLSLNFAFTPAVGQTFQIITSTAFVGSFLSFESTPSDILFTESGGIVTITATGTPIQNTFTFTGKGSWTNAGQWAGNTIPPNPLPAGSAIIIDGTGAAILSHAQTLNAGSALTVSGNDSLVISNSFSLTSSGILTNDGTLVNNGGTLNNSGGDLTNNGILTNRNAGTLNNPPGGSILTNNGTLNNTSSTLNIGFGAILNNNGNVANGGGLFIYAMGTLNNNAGAILTSSSSLNVDGTLKNVGTLNNMSLATINGTLTNTGSLNTAYSFFNYGTLNNNAPGIFTNTNALENKFGGTLNNNSLLINNGIFSQLSGSTFNNNGSLRGTGSIQGMLTNGVNGVLEPGSSPGCLSFSAGLTNLGTLVIEINGTTACTQFDQVQVVGTTTKGGTLTLAFGFTPTVGQTFQIITSTAFAGSFATITITPSNIQVTQSGGIVTITANLPVELTNFSAKALEKTTRLDWTTATETNNKGFFIERSHDAARWETLGFTPGQGNSTKGVSYSFVDEKPLNGRSYYRLLQVDFDGKEEHSSIVSITRTGSPGKVLVYPNPVIAGATCTLVSTLDAADEVLSLRLLDATGRQVATLANAQRLETRGLQPGIYWLEIRSAQGLAVERVVVQ